MAVAWTARAEVTPLDNWHWRSPLPQGNRLNNVAFVNGAYAAVGTLGTILTSNDGTDWLRRDTGVNDELRDCTFGAGIHVAVGDFGTVLTSMDSVTWTQRYAGTFYDLNAITFGDGQFVAVGDGTMIQTSPDGVNWTSRSSGEWELFDIIHTNGIFVAVGGTPVVSTGGSSVVREAVILTSPEAKIWTRRVIASGGPITSVAYGDGQFAAIGYNDSYWNDGLWFSSDAISWQSRQAPGWSPLNNIAHHNDQWVIVAGGPQTYLSNGAIVTSTDLLNWSQAETTTLGFSGVVSGNGQLVASRVDGTFLISSNGLSWTNPLPQSVPIVFRDLKFLNGTFCGMAGDRLYFSTNGSVWTNVVTLTNTGVFVTIAYGNGRYVAGADSGELWSSLDGISWTNSQTIYPPPAAITFGNGRFVGVSLNYPGSAFTSLDGLNWIIQEPDSEFPFFGDVTFGDQFVAVSEYATATSIDGANWSLNLGVHSLSGVAFGKGTYVAVGFNKIMTSSDGTNWITQTSNAFGSLYRVAYGGGYFVAVGLISLDPHFPQESPIWISTDAVHWSRRSSQSAAGLNTVAFGNGTFVVAGGGILQSDPIITLSMNAQPTPQLLLSGPIDRSYRIEYSDSLNPTNSWTTLTNITIGGSSTLISDPTGTTGPKRFYRVTMLP